MLSIASQTQLLPAAGAESNADAVISWCCKGLGNIAADLTALKAFQGAAACNICKHGCCWCKIN